MPGYLEGCKLLLEAKADVTIKDDYGWTPLELADSRGDRSEVRDVLLARGRRGHGRRLRRVRIVPVLQSSSS